LKEQLLVTYSAPVLYQTQAAKHRKFAEFKEGDPVWVHLRKEPFPRGQFAKLKPRADGPFQELFSNALVKMPTR